MQQSSSNPYLPSMTSRGLSDDITSTRALGGAGGSATSPSSTSASPSINLQDSSAGGASTIGHMPTPPLGDGPPAVATSGMSIGGGDGSSSSSSPGVNALLRRASSSASSPSRLSPHYQQQQQQQQHGPPHGLYGATPNLPSGIPGPASNNIDILNANLRYPSAASVASSSSRHASPMMAHPNLSTDGFPQRPLSRNLSRGNTYNHQHLHHGNETRTQLFVGNLPFRVRWQDLKDLFRKCGTVLRSDVALTLDNRSKGFGTVLFANEVDAYKAVDMYNGYTWQSRVLDVRLDAQDPHGNIAIANGVAQQAQQAAQASHQQAMQNMANIIGMNAAQAAMAAMQQQQQQQQGGQLLHPQQQQQQQHSMLNPGFATATPGGGGSMMPSSAGGPSSPWMVAARAASANAAATAAMLQQQRQSNNSSPFSQNHLSAGMASMNIRRGSFDSQRGPQQQLLHHPHLQQHPHLSAQHGMSHTSNNTPLVSPSVSSSSRPGTSTGVASTSASSTVPPISSSSSPPPTGAGAPSAQSPGLSRSTNGPPRDSVSPTSARRVPPGNLGQLPPSIFAGMPAQSQLPNPPAAAAAAKAAGYDLEDEASDGQQQQQQQHGSPFNGSALNHGSDGTSSGGLQQREDVLQQQQQQQQQHSGNLAAPVPLSVPGGGQGNFYAQNNGSNGAIGMQHQLGPYPHMHGGGGGAVYARNIPSPAMMTNRHLFVGNIPFNCQWQDLKDLFRAAGQILRADVSLGPDGRSRGFGTVLFASTEDALNAVQMFNGYDFQGRTLKVHFDKLGAGQGQQGPPGGGMMNGQQRHQQQQYHYGHHLGFDHSPVPQPAHLQQQHQYHQHHPQQFHQPSSQGNHTHLPPPQQPMSMGVHPGFQPNADGGIGNNSNNLFANGNFGFIPGHRHTISYDDNSSVPGTPIHELSLSNMNMTAGFPSPGFGSPIPQLPRQSSDSRRAGFNSDGVAVAPIGSGAPHLAGEDALRQQQQQQQQQQATYGSGGYSNTHQHPPPLSPLNIPTRNIGMGMPSPVHGTMFSPMMPGMGPMSPHQGLPMMTPSMPGFSFHPFPQTPPLQAQFLSPGLGPFSPPLAGTTTNFFGPATPSGLRNAAPGGEDDEHQDGEEATPLQSPDLSQQQYHHQQQQQEEDQQNGNYFPMMMAPQPITGQRHVRGSTDEGEQQGGVQTADAQDPTASGGDEDEPDTPKQAEEVAIFPSSVSNEQNEQPASGTENGDSSTPSPALSEGGAVDSTASAGVAVRRASFFATPTARSSSLAPPTSNAGMQRGGSLDIPRPVLDLDISSSGSTGAKEGGPSSEDADSGRNGSALEMDDDEEDGDDSATNVKTEKGSSSNSNSSSSINGNSIKKEEKGQQQSQQQQPMGVKKGPWNLSWLKK